MEQQMAKAVMEQEQCATHTYTYITKNGVVWEFWAPLKTWLLKNVWVPRLIITIHTDTNTCLEPCQSNRRVTGGHSLTTGGGAISHTTWPLMT